MKKFLGIVVLGLILFLTSSNKSFAIQGGYGELKLSNKVVDVFIKYIKGKSSKAPYIFAVALDGLEYQYWYCPAGLNNCRGGSPEAVIKDCEKYSRKYGSGAKCGVFAHNRTIKWNNGINPGKGKESKINSRWSDEEILAKLTELGFLGEATSSTESKDNTLEQSEETTQTNSNSNISQQLKSLNELYKSGALTKEEFKKAKKKILNN